MRRLLFTMLLLCVLAARGEEHPVPLDAAWTLPDGARLTPAGTLEIQIRPGKEANRFLTAQRTFDIIPYRGHDIELVYRLRAEKVTRPPQDFTGIKLILSCRSGHRETVADTPRQWNHGDFDWREVTIPMSVPEDARTAKLMVGLQNSSGLIEVRSITVRDLGERPDAEVSPAPYLPPRKKFRRADTIGIAATGPTKVQRSLNGMWKISELETAVKPFPADADRERGIERPEFDDSGWDEIAVPLNWYLKYPEKQSLREPYVKGWYRTTFDLAATELKQRRVILKFDVIGCDATLFLNGREVGRHLGDFTAFELDVTDAARPGRNTLAIRVFTDQGHAANPEKIHHAYGAQWSVKDIKGGIWQNVTLSLEPEIRIAGLFVTPRLAKSAVEVDYKILNHTGKTVKTALDFSATPAIRQDAGKLAGTRRHTVALQPGVNTGTVELPLTDPVRWSTTNPYLYFLVCEVKDAEGGFSRDAVRFGYREFAARDGKFFLNGEEIYLFGQNIGSKFGGNGLDEAQEERNILGILLDYRNLGYVMTRTSHMPILPLALEIADEIGMMIYHEWAWSFTTNLDFEAFERNNLREIAEFVKASYNHPSVCMWSLGNEIKHQEPGIARQLDLQYDTVRALDKSGRPACSFSGMGSWYAYGTNRLKTDVIDIHEYAGLASPWSRLPELLARQYEGELRIYGETGRLSRPLVAWETVGFSWGTHVTDRNFRRGDIGQYADYVNKPSSWGSPNGIGFIGCAPLFETLTPGFAEWAQALYGRRIYEIFRLDPNFSGFAPWFGGNPAATLWTQPLFPALRNENSLFPRNLFTGGNYRWRLELVNSNSRRYRAPQLELALHRTTREAVILHTQKLPEIAPYSRSSVPVALTVPAGLRSGDWQLRVTLREADEIVARNYYDLFLSPRPEKITGRRPLFVLDTGAGKNVAALETLLDEFGLACRRIGSAAEAAADSVLAVPPETAEPQTLRLQDDPAVAAFLNRGGTLLVLEQKNIKSILPGNRSPAPGGNTFVDVVTPDHPLFAGLDPARFDTWNNPDHGYVAAAAFLPYSPDALAVRGTGLGQNGIGGAVIEGTVGSGRVLLSQLEATACYRNDSAAAAYLRNLLAYAVGEERWEQAQPLSVGQSRTFEVRPETQKPIDLAPYANAPFRDEYENDGKGGWTDQGSNDFRMMPIGELTAAGVQFRIVDPARNGGRGCLVLRGSERPGLPAAVRGIRVHEKVSRLFFMHTAAWGNRGFAGAYRIRYADGKTVDYKLQGGKNIGDWWRVAMLPEAKVGIICRNAFGSEVGTFVAAWRNPRPEVRVDSFDFLSAGEAQDGGIDWLPSNSPVPVLVAVTAEKAEEKDHGQLR